MGNGQGNDGRRVARLAMLGFATWLMLLVFPLASCDSAPKGPTGPTVVPSACDLSFTLQQSSVPSGGGAGVVTVVASQAQCGWTATSQVPWIGGFTPPSGFGAGDVHFTVAANPNDGPRQGDIILNATHFRITQTGAACDTQISQANQSAPASGMSGTVAVTTGSSCAWAATSNVDWLVVTSDPTTVGEGIVQYTVAANPETTSRIGLIAIDSRVFTVTQAGK